MLNYTFISLLAIIKLVEWGGKNFSQSIDMTQTSYININQCLTYMTLLTQKLKLREKSDFGL